MRNENANLSDKPPASERREPRGRSGTSDLQKTRYQPEFGASVSITWPDSATFLRQGLFSRTPLPNNREKSPQCGLSGRKNRPVGPWRQECRGFADGKVKDARSRPLPPRRFSKSRPALSFHSPRGRPISRAKMRFLRAICTAIFSFVIKQIRASACGKGVDKTGPSGNDLV